MDTISFAQAAERLGVKVTRAHRLLNEHRLLALPDEQGKLQVVTEWVLAAQPLLDGQRPIDLLRAGSHSKVNSVAAMQAI